MMTPAQLDDVYGALVIAGSEGNAEALARICWQLYAELDDTRARAETLHGGLVAVARIVHAVASTKGSAPPEPRASGQLCPGCGGVGLAADCVLCGQPQDPGCGFGVEYTPPSADRPGQWRCTGCRAVAADERQAAGAPS
jgi:hypothetical protein